MLQPSFQSLFFHEDQYSYFFSIWRIFINSALATISKGRVFQCNCMQRYNKKYHILLHDISFFQKDVSRFCRNSKKVKIRFFRSLSCNEERQLCEKFLLMINCYHQCAVFFHYLTRANFRYGIWLSHFDNSRGSSH